MKGYNLPDNVDPNDPEAPWNKKEKERTWCIRNKATGDYWSNLFGWVEEEPISLFSDLEKDEFSLPSIGEKAEWELFNEENCYG